MTKTVPWKFEDQLIEVFRWNAERIDQLSQLLAVCLVQTVWTQVSAESA